VKGRVPSAWLHWRLSRRASECCWDSRRRRDRWVGGSGPSAPTTYWNPISLPNYPLGKRARDVTVGAPVPADDWLWLVDKQQQFREMADVSVLWHEGTWYMYPSVDMAWLSTDGGATWRHHPLNIRDVGYAPTIVRHKGKFLLMASESSVYSADAPLGPFKEIGPIKLAGAVPTQRLIEQRRKPRK
jgi:xylan 1,4-beta-xylosidase